MREVPPGPEFDRLRQEMEEHSAHLERQLLAGPDFPVYGVLEPRLGDGVVAETAASDGHLDLVQLAWGGYAFGAPGPALAVRTVSCAPGCPVWELEDLAETLADERDRRADEGDVDVPEPTRVTHRRALLLVDGVEIGADVRFEDECWAALLELPLTDDDQSVRLQVMVFAREVPLEQVRLGRVADLAPYVRGARELMRETLDRARRLASEQVVPEDLDLPVPQGFEAHRALIESSIADTLEMNRAARENRRPPRRPWRRADREAYVRRWESATRAQMHLAGQDRLAANEAVTALVNQMIQLTIHADWFEDPGSRAAAIEESIRWTVFDSEVPSRSAQEAWLATWTAEQSTALRFAQLAEDHDTIRARLDARSEGRMNWLAAWTAWHADRGA